jgi:uncharacterized protein (DUF302 family)
MKTYALLGFFISTMKHYMILNMPRSKAYGIMIRPAAAAFTSSSSFATTSSIKKRLAARGNQQETAPPRTASTLTPRFMTSTSGDPTTSSSFSSSLPEYGNPTYGLTKKLSSGITYPEAITKVTNALKEHGFGVLTEIDMRATMQKKLNVDLGRPYTILGACNPKLALNALQNSPAVGLFLPCNVAVLEDPDGRMVVSIVSPEEMFSIAAKDDTSSNAPVSAGGGGGSSPSSSGGGVEALAKEVQDIMKKVIGSL